MHKKTFSQADLNGIYRQHKKWLNDSKTGKRASYKDSIFDKLDFSNMNFDKAVFEKCSFKFSSFARTSFEDADLSYSDFSETHHVLENCFSGANLTGCNFGNKNLFLNNNIKRYENQYISYQRIYVFSSICAVVLFLFPKLLCELSITYRNITISIHQDFIQYVVIISSIVSFLMSTYFLKINAKNLTEQFVQLPRVFPSGEKRENKIDNSFLKSIFDIQDKDSHENEDMSSIELDFSNVRRAAICIEHNMAFFSASIFLMEFFKLIGESGNIFYLPLIIIPLRFEQYRVKKIYCYKVSAVIFCSLFVVFHNYFLSSLFAIISILCYPHGKFYSKIILFIYISFVFRTVYAYSLFPEENFVVQEFKKTCNVENYNITKVFGQNFDNMILKKLKAVGVDFSNKTFNNSDLSGADLRCGIFKNTSFHNSVLDYVDLRGAYIEDNAICNSKSHKYIKTDKPVFCVNVPISK